jgi:hypothetical protein
LPEVVSQYTLQTTIRVSFEVQPEDLEVIQREDKPRDTDKSAGLQVKDDFLT